MHFLKKKKTVRLSSAGPEILAFVSHCSVNFQPILDCFIPKFKLKYGNLENIKADCVHTVVLNLLHIKRQAFFWDTWYTIPYHTIPYHTIPYHTIPYHTIPYHTIPYHTIPYHTIPYHTIPYHTIPYHTIPYHTIPYHTIPYNMIIISYQITNRCDTCTFVYRKKSK